MMRRKYRVMRGDRPHGESHDGVGEKEWSWENGGRDVQKPKKKRRD